MTSDHPVIRSTSRASLITIGAIIVAILATALCVALLFRDRDNAQAGEEAAKAEKDKAVGQAQRVIDCVKNPAATPRRCAQVAEDAEDELDDVAVASTDGLSADERTQVADLVGGVIAARPGLSVADVTREVLDRIRIPTGRPGTPGADGADGDTLTADEARAIVEEVYAANPPRSGADGQPGETGARGPGCVEALGLEACRGPKGEPGGQGPAGTDGAAGRGIASLTCDQSTQQLVVTYTDGTVQPIEGSDCVVDVIPDPDPTEQPTDPAQPNLPDLLGQ